MDRLDTSNLVDMSELEIDPNKMYRRWLTALTSSDDEKAMDAAAALLEWVVSGGTEPSWGGRSARDSFVLWSQGMQVEGALDMEMSQRLVRMQ